jgi:hypothetical protein
MPVSTPCSAFWRLLSHFHHRPISTHILFRVALDGVKREDHAIIYTGKRPEILRGFEMPPAKSPIQVTAKSSRSELRPDSYLNYGKIYIVKHDAKVQFLGCVSEASMPTFMKDFAETWQAKTKIV